MEFLEGFCVGIALYYLVFDDDDDNDKGDHHRDPAPNKPLPEPQPKEWDMKAKPINNKEK